MERRKWNLNLFENVENCQICDNSIKRYQFWATTTITYIVTYKALFVCRSVLATKESALKTSLCQLNINLAIALPILTHAVRIWGYWHWHRIVKIVVMQIHRYADSPVYAQNRWWPDMCALRPKVIVLQLIAWKWMWNKCHFRNYGCG